MRWILTCGMLASLLLAACVAIPVPGPQGPVPASPTPTPSTEPTKTATPMPVGTWQTVIDGMIYDGETEHGEPIEGASVRYEVLHSYFAELQEGRPNKALTDELGGFELPVIVHDTDSVKILVEAQGYISYEERLVGVDLFGGKHLIIGLKPLPAGTTSPPLNE